MAMSLHGRRWAAIGPQTSPEALGRTDFTAISRLRKGPRMLRQG